jgi:hypothetical protein
MIGTLLLAVGRTRSRHRSHHEAVAHFSLAALCKGFAASNWDVTTTGRGRCTVRSLRTAVVVALTAVMSLLLASQASAPLPTASSRVLRGGQVTAIPYYNWYPGYYVLNSKDTAANKLSILHDPLVEPFTGVQFRYHWAASERSPGDYSAGFAALDADLKRVSARGKKIMVMLMYKKFDGTSPVPADLRTGPGPWCSGSYCGELTTDNDTSLALLWNPVVEARLKAWITAMALHLSESRYIDNVAGIVFNETSLGTTDTTVLASADYEPDVYIQALKDNMLAAITAAPRLITILYFEGGFVSMDGNLVRAVNKIGDWMLLHPRTGAGTPDLKPKNPKGTSHPCTNSKYQDHIACAPAVQAPDYATAVTDSFDQSFDYATAPLPDGHHASFFTFSYAVGTGPNAFTFAEVSHSIPDHPIPNIARPWPVNPVAGAVRKISLTSPVRAGKDVSLRVSVSPRARCTIKVIYDTVVSKARGLGPKSGSKISWRWRVGTSTSPGRWPIIINCGKSGTLRLSLRVLPR